MPLSCTRRRDEPQHKRQPGYGTRSMAPAGTLQGIATMRVPPWGAPSEPAGQGGKGLSAVYHLGVARGASCRHQYDDADDQKRQPGSSAAAKKRVLSKAGRDETDVYRLDTAAALKTAKAATELTDTTVQMKDGEDRDSDDVMRNTCTALGLQKSDFRQSAKAAAGLRASAVLLLLQEKGSQYSFKVAGNGLQKADFRQSAKAAAGLRASAFLLSLQKKATGFRKQILGSLPKQLLGSAQCPTPGCWAQLNIPIQAMNEYYAVDLPKLIHSTRPADELTFISIDAGGCDIRVHHGTELGSASADLTSDQEKGSPQSLRAAGIGSRWAKQW
eukprot:gene27151-2384_t